MRLPKKKWKPPEPKRLNAEWMTFAPDKRKTIPDEQVLGNLIGAWRPAQRFLWSDDQVSGVQGFLLERNRDPFQRRCRSRIPSQLRAQALQQSAESFFVSAIPAPLALLHRVDQTRLGEDGHVMRDGGLGEPHAFFNIAGAEAGMLSDCEGAGGSCAALFEGTEDLAPRGIGNGMELVVERCRRRGHRME